VTSGQYVDLAVLLQKSNPTQDLGPKLTISPASHVTMAQATQNNKISNIEEWSDAFLIYAIIYLSAHPSATQVILKYFIILLLAML
jgi:hypothetical protein